MTETTHSISETVGKYPNADTILDILEAVDTAVIQSVFLESLIGAVPDRCRHLVEEAKIAAARQVDAMSDIRSMLQLEIAAQATERRIGYDAPVSKEHCRPVVIKARVSEVGDDYILIHPTNDRSQSITIPVEDIIAFGSKTVKSPKAA